MAAPSKDLLPVYLAVGEDQLMREAVLKRIKTRVAELGDLDFNSELFDGESSYGVDIVSSCNTFPFASEKRLVVVKNVEKLAKESQEQLISYISDPAETTVLILLATKLAKNTRLYKAVAATGSTAVIDCGERSRKELPSKVRDMALSKGLVLTPRVAELLVARAGTSTVKIDTELTKLAAYVGDRKDVTVEDIERVVVATAEIKPWDLQDALAKRDIHGCVDLLERMFAAGQSPHALIALCLTRIRDLITAKALDARGLSGSALAAAAGQQEWRMRNIVGWSRNYTSDELIDALTSAARTDAKMKSGSDPQLAMELWLYAIVS